jgi:glucose-1-phosphatase
LKTIKNIIFDLGGVIINLDYALTIYEFNRLSEIPFESIYTQAKQNELFNEFETGKIHESVFFESLQNAIRYKGPTENLIHAWNAMLLDVPQKRLDFLIDIKLHYKTFLLSNTNETHIEAFEKELYLRNGVKNFSDYFDKMYYSCRINMRKPDREIFEFVLADNKLLPEETIFIDDSIQHVKAAGDCGINAYLLSKPNDIIHLFNELNLLKN